VLIGEGTRVVAGLLAESTQVGDLLSISWIETANQAKFAAWIEGRGAEVWRSLLASLGGTANVLLVGEGAEGRFLDALRGELRAADRSKNFYARLPGRCRRR
jgi:hypothetical protein